MQDACDFEIDWGFVDGCLRVSVTGHNGSLENTVACWRQIAAQVRRLRPSMLLVVDVMDGGPPPAEQMRAFVAAMEGQGMRGLRIAYIEDKIEAMPVVELASIHALEHGFDVQVFDDEHVAERWLRYGADHA